MGWGGFLDKLLEKLPIQGRVERWKNRLDEIEKEINNLEANSWTPEKGEHYISLIDERRKLNVLLKNKAT